LHGIRLDLNRRLKRIVADIQQSRLPELLPWEWKKLNWQVPA
jgi:hypothetical protein